MIIIENGDRIRGDASAANVVDYTLHGIVSTTLTQLSDGQLPATIGDLFAAVSHVVVHTIILVNTDTVARTINLYLTPSGGTARRLIPKDVSLSAGYSLHFDGSRVRIMSTTGEVVAGSPPTAHATSHQDGGADEVNIGALSGTPAELTTHAAGADPHTGYQKESEKGAASGYASLDAGILVPSAQIPSLDVAKITTGRFGMPRMPAGTSGQVLTAQGAGADPAYAAAGVAVDYQAFTTGGTWTKPSGVTAVYVMVVGAGGGGGGGYGAAADTARGGGAGAGGAAANFQLFRAADLGATEAVTIGASGAGGSSGSDGSVGGATDFGTKLYAYGGGGGRGGFTTTRAGGSGGGIGSAGTVSGGSGGGPGGTAAAGSGFEGGGGSTTNADGNPAAYGGAQGAGSSATAAGKAGGSSVFGGAGGGGGGSVSIGNVEYAGGAGGNVGTITAGGGGAAGAVDGGAGGAGAAGTTIKRGQGGGGGGGQGSGTGGAGGVGGQPGGGGGGGAGGTSTGGAGGAGGAGAVYVWSW